MKLNLSYILILLLALPWTDMPAQSEVRLNREKWEAISKKLDYPIPTAEAEDIQEADPATGQAWATFFKVLAILGAIAIIVFILHQLLSGDSLFAPKNRKFESGLQINLENIEANLPEADLPDFIRQAAQAGDFRMAVRLHYLRLLQLLLEQKWIEWKKDKTNGDYLLEMQNRPAFGAFRQITGVFERIWYGDRRLSPGAYQMVADRFNALERDIKRERTDG
jgi:hypothetical protein